jgi:hypothetical protein
MYEHMLPVYALFQAIAGVTQLIQRALVRQQMIDFTFMSTKLQNPLSEPKKDM